jgi:hypothetical protein
VVAGFGVADDHSMSFFACALVIGTLLCPGVTGVAPAGRTHSVSDMQDGSQFTDEEEQGRLAKAALEELAAESGWRIVL